METLSLCPPSSGMFQGSRNNESPPVAQAVKEGSSLVHCCLRMLSSGYCVPLEICYLLGDQEEVGPVGGEKVTRLPPQEGDEVA